MPSKCKYDNKGLFRNKTLLDHLIDPKHANDHHFIRLIFVVLDAVKQAKLDVHPDPNLAKKHMVEPFQKWVGDHQKIIPAKMKTLYQDIYNVIESKLTQDVGNDKASVRLGGGGGK